MTRRLYSLVTRGLWADARFLQLSGPDPNAKTLWLYLLTGPVQGPIPGLFAAGVGTLADGLGWSYQDTGDCLEELEQQGLVCVSERPPLIWLPNAVKHNPPGSPNVVKSWGSVYQELPEAPLREEAMLGIRELLRGEAFVRAFDQTFPDLRRNPFGKASRNPSGNPSGKAYPKGSGKGLGRGGAEGSEGISSEGSGPRTSDPNHAESGLFPGRNPSGKPSGKPSWKGSPNQDQGSKKKKKDRRKSEEEAEQLAVHLREEIRSHTPRIAEKYDGTGAKLAGWERDLEKLLRLDGASAGEVQAVITWAHRKDPRGFWRGNLLSGLKVREHFDRLLIQAKQGGQPLSGSSGETSGWMHEHHRWLLRWRDERTALGEPLTEEGLLGACDNEGLPRPGKPGGLLSWLEARR